MFASTHRIVDVYKMEIFISYIELIKSGELNAHWRSLFFSLLLCACVEFEFRKFNIYIWAKKNDVYFAELLSLSLSSSNWCKISEKKFTKGTKCDKQFDALSMEILLSQNNEKTHTHTHMEWHTLSQGKRTLHTNRVFSLSVSRESGPEAINDNASRTGKKVQLLDLIAVMENLFKNSFRLWVWVWNKRLQVARHNSGDGSDSSATKIERRGEGMKEEKTHHDTQLKKFLQKQLVIFVHLPWAIGKQCLAGLLAGYGMCYTSGYACW